MKAAIVYASVHHGNTKKVVEEMANAISAEVIDITKNENPSLSQYDVIGFASGIYFNSFHKEMSKYIQEADFTPNQRVFLVYTCCLAVRDYSKGIKKVLSKKKIPCIGSFHCRGYDTFGIFGKIGGIAKNHPNDKDLKNAQEFALKIRQE